MTKCTRDRGSEVCGGSYMVCSDQSFQPGVFTSCPGVMPWLAGTPLGIHKLSRGYAMVGW